MTNLPRASTIVDTITSIDIPTVDLASVDLPSLDELSDVLSDAGEALAAGAEIARRRSARIVRGTARLGARGGKVAGRTAYVGVRASGRALGRGAVGTVRVARKHPRVSAGVAGALLALVIAYLIARRSSAGDSSSDAHLAAVA